ncbi:MAG: hypothetical protein Q4D19_14405, partial [Lautropia sp.]|nr:hypothetical protein [Lautropia sp.]
MVCPKTSNRIIERQTYGHRDNSRFFLKIQGGIPRLSVMNQQKGPDMPGLFVAGDLVERKPPTLPNSDQPCAPSRRTDSFSTFSSRGMASSS